MWKIDCRGARQEVGLEVRALHLIARGGVRQASGAATLRVGRTVPIVEMDTLSPLTVEWFGQG